MSTYLPLESNGLATYPGLPGTNLAVGNSGWPEEACDEEDDFVFDCVVSLRATRGAAVDDGVETLSLSIRGCCWRVEATSDSTGRPGSVTSDSIVSVEVTSAVDASSRFRRKA